MPSRRKSGIVEAGKRHIKNVRIGRVKGQAAGVSPEINQIIPGYSHSRRRLNAPIERPKRISATTLVRRCERDRCMILAEFGTIREPRWLPRREKVGRLPEVIRP